MAARGTAIFGLEEPLWGRDQIIHEGLESTDKGKKEGRYH